jgi:hypothetical protein
MEGSLFVVKGADLLRASIGYGLIGVFLGLFALCILTWGAPVAIGVVAFFVVLAAVLLVLGIYLDRAGKKSVLFTVLIDEGAKVCTAENATIVGDCTPFSKE